MPDSRWNRILPIVFAALFLFNSAHLLLGFLSIPLFYERVTTLTIQDLLPAMNVPTNESVQRSAVEHGMTLSQYAIEQIVFDSAIVLLFMVVAVLIVARARWNWYAWYSACFLSFIAGYALYQEVYVANLLPPSVYETGALFWPLVLLYLFLFPNGRPVPRRALWILLPYALVHFALQFIAYLSTVFPDAVVWSAFESSAAPIGVFITFIFVSILGCQVYRYLRVSTREEKQQTKWFLSGFVCFLVLSGVSDALGANNPYHDEVGLLIFAFVPVSVGISILRYRLWDIDIIIRKTVTYTILTALLALIYFGGVLVFQQVFRGVIGHSTDLAIAVSTLAIAALFFPLRRRVQSVIDRRFYRRKYDAAKTLAAFSATARDEVELEKLTAELLNVVQETMQPASVSLWLKPTDNPKWRTTP